MAEFLVALAVLLPLFLALAYAGRYGDLQQSATQASRYAAFQRAREPDLARLPNEILADQMRARFFLDGDYLNAGRLQSDDSVTQLKKDTGAPYRWKDLAGQPLLATYDNVTLNFVAAGLGTGSVAGALGVMTKTAGKTYPGGQVARVEVTLANKLDLSTGTPRPMVLAAATAAAGNALSSSGTIGTRDAASTLVPSDDLPEALTGLVSGVVGLFEKDGPDFGCIKPDVVPRHRLDGTADNSVCK